MKGEPLGDAKAFKIQKTHAMMKRPVKFLSGVTVSTLAGSPCDTLNLIPSMDALALFQDAPKRLLLL
jgi:hypothetical protein